RLAKGDERGRGVEADPVPRRLQHRGQQGRGRALAIGATDLRDREALFGMAERAQEPFDPLESWPHARMLAAAKGEQPGDRLGVGHPDGVGWSAKNARRRRSVSRSWPPSTMRSSWPCSIRNSDPWKPPATA